MIYTAKKRITYTGLILVVVLVFYWIYSHSYIEVSVKSGSTGSLSYELKNQRNDKPSVAQSGTGNIKKLVAKGNYEVLVRQGEKSYFAVVKTKGFLGTTHVAASLKAEKSRKFVGNNPEPCMSYTENVLISYVCGDYYGNAKIHIPATNAQPTYSENPQNPTASGRLEGIVQIGADNFAAIYGSIEEDAPAAHQIYKITSGFKLEDRVVLTDLDPAKSYSVRNTAKGFVAYDDAYSKVLYYSSPKAKPEALRLEAPADKSLSPQAFDAQANDYLTLYSPLNAATTKKSNSEVIITKEGQSNHFKFNKKYSKGIFCASQRVCLISSEGLDVYDISSKKASLKFSVTGAIDVMNGGGGLLAVRNNEVINIDSNDQTGFIEYSFGDFRFNAISYQGSSYVLSLTDNKDRKIALLISQAADDSGSIDKKIEQLQKMSQVSLVSIYDKYIYISPNAGPLTYISSINGYGYDPTLVKTTKNMINLEVDKLGIDKSVYTVINTLE
jgi:hypothetical protein